MKLWEATNERKAKANVNAFIDLVNERFNLQLHDFQQLYIWSVDNDEDFWEAVWDFTQVMGDKGYVRKEEAPVFYETQFFPDARLNFAENLLRRRDDAVAIHFWGENQIKRALTYRQLYEQVSQVRQYLQTQGIKPGDRVAAVLPNMPETIIAMLATTSLGAIWSSCSPDFGGQGIIDRFAQIEPDILFFVDSYFYNGKVHGCKDKLAVILPSLPSVKGVVRVNYAEDKTELNADKQVYFAEIVERYPPTEIEFIKFAFNHPLYILFSSGTTGVPKCIVHRAGGVLLQHLKELVLHTDIHSDERLFYFTTCGWMMWNWMVSALAAKASLCLYDGSPFVEPTILFDYIDAENINVFGTSAKYIDALAKMAIKPRQTHQLTSLNSLLSTGSPLSKESFSYVYDHIKSDVCLSSIAGGTDIVSCFVVGSPLLPVYQGEAQTRGLGLAVNVFNRDGQPVMAEKGELVCTKPFPCMPLGFWGDTDREKYHSAYFAKYANVWCHGDYVELSEHGGMIFYGRSDSILNPGGVRIGTAEIYRQVEKLAEVIESVVIGQQVDGDERVVLFVHLRESITLDDKLISKIKQQIRENTTPRHVPAVICQVSAIPKTKSGKVVEIAVRDVVHGKPINNKEAIANPEVLTEYENRKELRF